MGRHKIEVDWDVADRILMSGAGASSIAKALGISVATITRACKRDHKVDFDAYRAQKLALGADELIKKGYQMAIKGDRTMLIFYLKNRAGYADRTINDTNVHLPSAVEDRANKLLDSIEEAEEKLKHI